MPAKVRDDPHERPNEYYYCYYYYYFCYCYCYFCYCYCYNYCRDDACCWLLLLLLPPLLLLDRMFFCGEVASWSIFQKSYFGPAFQAYTV